VCEGPAGSRLRAPRPFVPSPPGQALPAPAGSRADAPSSSVVYPYT
jgi:hypothetical protein